VLEGLQQISNLANIYYIGQKEPNGLGHAIFSASSFIGNEPITALLGDDNIDAEKPILKKLFETYEEYKCSWCVIC
jgi:UTP--glucose-1-phosphate uridylyltransferase